ncbi:MAG TPA: hypothetical protein VF458_20910 [Ktedonobacteraceae bacterium]
MYDKEDFFAPDTVDEQLDLSLCQREADLPYQSQAEGNPNLLLISDLRYLYGAEGTENVRSLQRVWEHLQQRPARPEPARVSAEEERPHLRLVRPAEEISTLTERRHRGRYGRGFAALAAVLFLVVMVGSLLMIVRLTHIQPNISARTTATVPPAVTPEPTLSPNYPYAPPGNQLAVSLPSSEAFAALAWSPDSKRLALSTQGRIWTWDVASKSYRALLNASLAGGSVKALAWSPDGRYLAVGSNPIQIVDSSSGNVIYDLSADYPLSPVPGQTTLVTALGWSPDGTMLAVATQHTNGACLVFVWSRAKGTGVNTFYQQGSASGITSLSWGDNQYVASTDGKTVQAWDILNTRNVIFKHTVDAATTVAWSPAKWGQLAFVDQREAQVWNVWKKQPVSHYPAASGLVSWDRTGQYLAAADGQTVILFDITSGARVYTYTGAAHFISSLAWSPDGSAIAIAESGPPGSNIARVWSA